MQIQASCVGWDSSRRCHSGVLITLSTVNCNVYFRLSLTLRRSFNSSQIYNKGTGGCGQRG